MAMQTESLERPRQAGAGREEVAASFQASIQIFGTMKAWLYQALCRGVVGSEELLALGAEALAGARPAHLFSAVHYLLLREPEPPLAGFFATLTDDPAPPEQAFPHFERYCRAHRDEIVDILRTRTVQTTYVERCAALAPLVSFVAAQAGEPLNLVEIGCSAGVLLAFDKYAYDTTEQGRVGAPDAPLALEAEVYGGPPMRLRRIGRRVGLDLRLIDVRAEAERLWLLALCFPELHAEQKRLARALEVVAATEIDFLEGDALALLPKVLAETPDPLCLYSSACLLYWSAEGRAALEALLTQASRGRSFYRVSLEPTEDFDAWAKGRSAAKAAPAKGVASIVHYRDGTAEGRAVADRLGPLSGLRWTDDRPF